MNSRTKPNRKGPHLQGLRGHVIKGGLNLDDIAKFVKGAVAELRRGKYISKGADLYSQTPLPYSGIVGTVGKLAGQAGFGKKRRGRPRTKTVTVAVKRRVGRPRKTACGGALSLAQRRGLVPKPAGYMEGSGNAQYRPKLAQRQTVKPSGPAFGKGLKVSGGGLSIAGGSKLPLRRKVVFP